MEMVTVDEMEEKATDGGIPDPLVDFCSCFAVYHRRAHDRRSRYPVACPTGRIAVEVDRDDTRRPDRVRGRIGERGVRDDRDSQVDLLQVGLADRDPRPVLIS